MIHSDRMEFVQIHTDAGGVGIGFECPTCGDRLIWSKSMWWELECSCGRWNFDITAEIVKDEK